MHQFLKYLFTIYFFISFNTFLNASNLIVDINYESGMQLDSQKNFNKRLSLVTSKKELRRLLDSQDWISSYSMRSLPFKNEVKISITNRTPIFILNKNFYIDKNLKKFQFDSTVTSLVNVDGDIKDLNDVMLLLNLFSIYEETEFALISIDFNHIRGWLINTNSSEIKLGKELDFKKIKNIKDTLNYLYDKRKIPKIIDLRYKDGAALKYG
tara:strand:- start:1665 stop:2297 length:633 start_codon:yes stop_codon:yes gene_type:complete